MLTTVLITLAVAVLLTVGLFYFYSWAVDRGMRIGATLGAVAAVSEMKKAINDELAKRAKHEPTDTVH